MQDKKKQQLTFDLPPDRYGRVQTLHVDLATGPDGTVGVRISGSRMLRLLNTGSPSETYVTVMDPRDVRREIQNKDNS